MYTVEFWDKKSPINKVSAEKYLTANPEMEDVNVILLRSGNIITRIEDPDILRSVYKWEGKTDEEVAQLYLEHVSKEDNN